MAQAVHIFIAYARKDSALLDEFRVHLRPLERADKLRIWYDGLIEPGAEWEADIKKNLHAADIILLLVSADAIASDYFYDKEVADALDRHRQGSARVVPMIVRPCAWRTTPLAELQALPKDGKPVTSWSDRDEAFTYAAEALWDMAHSIQQQREEKSEAARREKEAAEEARRAAQKAKEEEARKAEQERLQRAEAEKRRQEEEDRREKEAAQNMVLVKGDAFDMGGTPEQKDCRVDEKPVTRVTVDDFYMGKYAVTVREFKQFMEATGYKTDAEKDGGSNLWTGSEWKKKAGVNWKCDVKGKVRPDSEHNHPVIHVSWNDAVAFCNWLSEQQNLAKVYTISGEQVTADWNAKGYRLPTEAEWEYAARGGGQAVLFGNGKNVADPKEINFAGSAAYKKAYSVAGEYRQKTVPVGSLNSPNALGLHDMSGNVWEWCWDWKAPYPGGNKNNYRGPASGSYRVCRGGSWYDFPQGVRVASRFNFTPGSRSGLLGFRLARAVR
jgi:formylglycine-generating enzyme required for sulfatase activity